MTVDELIDYLSGFDKNTKIMIEIDRRCVQITPLEQFDFEYITAVSNSNYSKEKEVPFLLIKEV